MTCEPARLIAPVPASSGVTPPLSLVLVGGMGAIGDNLYRLHQPAAALADLPGVEVFEVHPQARHHDAAVLAADVVVFTMTLDVEVFRLIHQRRQLGRPSLCEVNDYLPDVQAWNPAHASWSDRRVLFCFDQLIRRCDATQVTTEALGQRLVDRARRVAVVKFLEYASRAVVPLLQNLDPYRHLDGTGAALLFDDPADLIRQLDRLVTEPPLRQTIAGTAYALVGRERRLAVHAPARLALYRDLAQRTWPVPGCVEPLLRQAADRPLTSLPGLRQLAPAHWRLGLDSPADQQRRLGVEALQRGALTEAADALTEAVRLDPGDAHAFSFLAHCLHARAARHYGERAAALNPLERLDPLPVPEEAERP